MSITFTDYKLCFEDQTGQEAQTLFQNQRQSTNCIDETNIRDESIDQTFQNLQSLDEDVKEHGIYSFYVTLLMNQFNRTQLFDFILENHILDLLLNIFSDTNMPGEYRITILKTIELILPYIPKSIPEVMLIDLAYMCLQLFTNNDLPMQILRFMAAILPAFPRFAHEIKQMDFISFIMQHEYEPDDISLKDFQYECIVFDLLLDEISQPIASFLVENRLQIYCQENEDQNMIMHTLSLLLKLVPFFEFDLTFFLRPYFNSILDQNSEQFIEPLLQLVYFLELNGLLKKKYLNSFREELIHILTSNCESKRNRVIFRYFNHFIRFNPYFNTHSIIKIGIQNIQSCCFEEKQEILQLFAKTLYNYENLTDAIRSGILETLMTLDADEYDIKLMIAILHRAKFCSVFISSDLYVEIEDIINENLQDNLCNIVLSDILNLDALPSIDSDDFFSEITTMPRFD